MGAVISTGTDPTDVALALQTDQRAETVGGARYLFAAGAAPVWKGQRQKGKGTEIHLV